MQIDKWNDRGTSIDARAFNCTVSDSEKSKVLQDVAAGEPMLLYTTPESLVGNALMQEAIKVLLKSLCCYSGPKPILDWIHIHDLRSQHTSCLTTRVCRLRVMQESCVA